MAKSLWKGNILCPILQNNSVKSKTEKSEQLYNKQRNLSASFLCKAKR